MIELRNVVKSYPEDPTGSSASSTRALDGLSLRVEPHELVALVGPSGCGKTTSLKLVNRLIEPDEGDVLVREKPIADLDPIGLRRSIGYVVQRFGLLPHRTLAENVGTVPRLLGWSKQVIQERVEELLILVGLPPKSYGERYPAQLSGGQQQRVGVARALAARPDILLMDEPFGALDPVTRSGLQREFRQLHEQQRLTTVLVTHDMLEALLLADRIIVLEAGRVVQEGTPRVLLRSPATESVRHLLETPKRQIEELGDLLGPL